MVADANADTDEDDADTVCRCPSRCIQYIRMGKGGLLNRFPPLDLLFPREERELQRKEFKGGYADLRQSGERGTFLLKSAKEGDILGEVVGEETRISNGAMAPKIWAEMAKFSRRH